MARIYDPLGLIAPVIVTAKIFIQKLCHLQLQSDDTMPEQQQQEWSPFRQELRSLTNLRIPRHVFRHKLMKAMQLHVFTDASEKAYGAAVYVRSENSDGTITVQLLCSKSRVAPLKTQTIPRLELCAALLGAELITKVKHDLRCTNHAVHLWTDSEIVLCWINSQSSTLQTFVSHRVSKIQDLTLAEQWRHVASKDNPADVLSRGISPADISNCSIWFWGPLFLHGNEHFWPSKFPKELSLGTELEVKKPRVTLAPSLIEDVVHMVYKINNRGSIVQLQRIIGYVHRFITNARLKTKDRPSTRALSVS